ncbi:hypothetical protein Pla110_44460 [Polystyrenella longa]|uniref:Uncharacterized protein n=1 Tax=Polystyrenella longa TaxID=2528007 RepID=A0A518CTZ2_9PLAN|nr:hypothetical protein [Polystyrenella longa]QDU82685.1 hypothetical protein Pla110_44460 [Polystyrenella longa]
MAEQPVFSYKVYLSSQFGGNWTYYPSVFIDTMRLQAGPSVDEVILRHRYGTFTSQIGQAAGVVAYLPMERQYVKIELTGPEESPGVTPYPFQTWYGFIELEEREIFFDRSGQPTGDQVIRAYGLLRLLELNFIRKAHYVDSEGTEQIIRRGITFNSAEHSTYPQRGNMADQRAGNNDGYLFSHKAYGASRWKASDAVRYLLQIHAPRAQVGEVGYWELTGNTPALDWYDITVPTDGRSVKSVLDDLIDRRRMVGYTLNASESSGNMTVQLEVFTFNEETIQLPPTYQVFPNENTIELDLGNDPRIASATLTNNFAHVVDEVVARGSLVTSTFSIWYTGEGDPSEAEMLKNGWVDDDEVNYKKAATETAGYGDLEIEEKEELNTIARSRDAVRDVFSRFVMDDQWELDGLIVPDEQASPSAYYHVAVVTDAWEYMDNDDISSAVTSGTFAPLRTRISDKRFLDTLPVPIESDQDVFDITFREPFTVFRQTDEVDSSDIWEMGEYLAANADTGGERTRQFSVTTQMLSDALGIRLQVSAAGGQHLIRRSEADSIIAELNGAETPLSLDATLKEVGAVDYEDSITTVAMEWDLHLEAVVGTEATSSSGVHSRTMIIDVPDARFDIRLPGTVKDVNEDGSLELDENGSILRDDRERVEQIAKAAAQWYGTKRQALRIVHRGHANHLELGHLVTSIGASYPDSSAMSVVTSIVHDWQNGNSKTTVETSYGELDVV